MIDYKKIIKNRELRLKLITLLKFIPDAPYLQLVYFIKNGKFLNLKHPKTFCEKLNWLKLHAYKPEYSQYVDKLTVGSVVEQKLGKDITIPILGHWDHYSQIDFESLPDQFVLKCNHDSGSVKIIKDKNTINHKELEHFFEGRLKIDNSIIGRDYYKNIHPCIIAEKYMTDENEPSIPDYKFFCFNGEPKLMFITKDRFNEATETYFDMDFNFINMHNSNSSHNLSLEKPKNFEKMKQIAKTLSKDLKFCRIDLYDINGEIYFGEFTFFEAGGFYPFKPDELEQKLGDWIDLGDTD